MVDAPNGGVRLTSDGSGQLLEDRIASGFWEKTEAKNRMPVCKAFSNSRRLRGLIASAILAGLIVR